MTSLRQYLAVLSAHVEAASGGSIGTTKLASEQDEVRQVLAEAGVPFGSPLHVLHAYKLRNARLEQEFNRKLKSSSGVSGASPVASPGGSNGAAPLPPPQGYTHRLLAMRLPPRSVEHLLVHGLRPKPPVTSARDWQVDPRTVPEAGCVDMESLASIVAASVPPPPPFALFSGPAAWEELLASTIEEAVTARDGLAAGLASSHGGEHGHGHAKGAAAGSTPTNRLIVLCRVLVPISPSEAVAERLASGGSAGGSPGGSPPRHAKGGAASAAALAQARLAAACPPSGTASTTDPEMILPLYLLHYGTMTAPPPEPQMPPAPLSQSSGSEKNVAQVEKAAPSEPRAVRNDSRGASKGGTTRAAAAAAAEAAGGGKGGGGSRGAAAPAAKAASEAEFGKLPAALRATREHQVYLSCRAATAERMREVAGVFAATIEGMTQQLTPARSNAMIEDERREAELQMLLNDAKAELSKLKKTNRDLASELNTTY